MSADTSSEAVERLAQLCTDWTTHVDADNIRAECAVALRALAQERDDARMCAEAEAEIANEMKAERDAARAEAERYRIALADLVSWQDAWPKIAQRLAQEGQHMQDAVTAARAVLAGKDPDAALAATEGKQ